MRLLKVAWQKAYAHIYYDKDSNVHKNRFDLLTQSWNYIKGQKTMKSHNYLSNNLVTNKGGVECISILIEVIWFTNLFSPKSRKC